MTSNTAGLGVFRGQTQVVRMWGYNQAAERSADERSPMMRFGMVMENNISAGMDAGSTVTFFAD